MLRGGPQATNSTSNISALGILAAFIAQRVFFSTIESILLLWLPFVSLVIPLEAFNLFSQVFIILFRNVVESKLPLVRGIDHILLSAFRAVRLHSIPVINRNRAKLMFAEVGFQPSHKLSHAVPVEVSTDGWTHGSLTFVGAIHDLRG